MKLTKTTAAALGVALTLSLAGCAADSPFDQEGEGTLRLRMVVNSEVTRAAMDQQTLADSCWVYISDAKGLLYKYHGLENLPASLPLKSGSYVAEAWTVIPYRHPSTASFIAAISPSTSVATTCRAWWSTAASPMWWQASTPPRIW